MFGKIPGAQGNEPFLRKKTLGKIREALY